MLSVKIRIQVPANAALSEIIENYTLYSRQGVITL